MNGTKAFWALRTYPTNERRYSVRRCRYEITRDGFVVAKGAAWGEDAAWYAGERRMKRLQEKMGESE